MAIIDDIVRHINEKQDEIFDLKTNWKDVIRNFENINFLGEVDDEVLYVTMLHQIQSCKDGRLINVDENDLNQFLLVGQFNKQEEVKYFSWTFWRINLDTRYISVYLSFNGDPKKSPKDNYIIAHEQLKLYEDQIMNYEANYCDLMPYDREIFDKLIAIVEYSKTNEVKIANFNRKVFRNIAEYFGQTDKGLIDDKYRDSNRTEIISIPQKHDLIQIRNDSEMVNIMRGMSFLEVNWEKNAVIRKFQRYKDLHDYLYSLVDYINKNNLSLEISQQIKQLEKYWESNKWPIPTTEEQRTENKNLYTRYEIAVTKFDSKVKIRADIQEYGICYYLAN